MVIVMVIVQRLSPQGTSKKGFQCSVRKECS